MNKIFQNSLRTLFVALMACFACVLISSCTQDDIVPTPVVVESSMFDISGSDSVSITTRSSSNLINFGSTPQKWQRIKTGSSVNLYKHETDGSIYITDIDLTNARIGLMWGTSSTSPQHPERNYGCYRFQKKTLQNFVVNENNLFVSTNFGFFWTDGESSYPFKQSNFVEIGASKTSNIDYTQNNLYAMIVDDGVGVRLNSFSGSNLANFSSTYAGNSKVYVVRNNKGNHPDASAYRTIISVTTKSGNHYKRMYLLVTNKSMKEADAKGYLQDFMEKQELMCSNWVFIPLDGGGSSQLYAKNLNNGTTLHLQGDGRTIINAFVVKN